jgi:glycosyltransferase involved in cell wall biosynthesis
VESFKVPTLSVAITAKNSAGTITSLVEQLSRQQVDVPWEIVVSVGDSSDQTWSVLSGLVPQHPNLVVVRAPRVGIPAGRNVAIDASRGQFILTCDADDKVGGTWVMDMFSALQSSDVVAGDVVIRADERSQAIAVNAGLRTFPYSYLPYGLTANLGFRRSTYDLVGGFDEHMRYADDVDFCWTVQQRGMRIVRAKGMVVKTGRPTGRQRFRQHMAYGQTDPLLYRKHRKAGMPRSALLAAKSWGWLALTAGLLPSKGHRYSWMGVAGHRTGRLIGSFKARVVYL